jgi:hypothetical protein
MSSNFLQWNPNSANQESDAQYTLDTMRTGGAGDPAIFPSNTANKLFYQLSTFTAAFAQALSNKGYTITDTSLNNLAAQRANVITAVDLVPYLSKALAAATYAPLVSAALQGAPTAPTPATADSTTKLATTAYVQNQGYAPESWVTAFFAQLSQFVLGTAGNGTQAYYKLPGGFTIQFGAQGVGTATTITFPQPFASGFFQFFMLNIGPGGGAMDARILGAVNVNSQSVHAWCYDTSGNPSSTNVSWVAIGF